MWRSAWNVRRGDGSGGVGRAELHGSGLNTFNFQSIHIIWCLYEGFVEKSDRFFEGNTCIFFYHDTFQVLGGGPTRELKSYLTLVERIHTLPNKICRLANSNWGVNESTLKGISQGAYLDPAVSGGWICAVGYHRGTLCGRAKSIFFG